MKHVLQATQTNERKDDVECSAPEQTLLDLEALLFAKGKEIIRRLLPRKSTVKYVHNAATYRGMIAGRVK